MKVEGYEMFIGPSAYSAVGRSILSPERKDKAKRARCVRAVWVGGCV